MSDLRSENDTETFALLSGRLSDEEQFYDSDREISEASVEKKQSTTPPALSFQRISIIETLNM